MIREIFQTLRRGMRDERTPFTFAVPMGLPRPVRTGDAFVEKWAKDWNVTQELPVWIVTPSVVVKRLLGIKPRLIEFDLAKVTGGRETGIATVQSTYVGFIERHVFPFPYPERKETR